MKSRSLIIFGCVLALGIASCGGGQEEPGTSDTTAVDTLRTTPAPDTTVKVDSTDTTLIDRTRTDTAIITTDTTVKTGKTVTTSTRETKGSTKSSSSGSKTTREPVQGNSEVRGSTVRRGNSEGGTVESQPRR